MNFDGFSLTKLQKTLGARRELTTNSTYTWHRPEIEPALTTAPTLHARRLRRGTGRGYSTTVQPLSLLYTILAEKVPLLYTFY